MQKFLFFLRLLTLTLFTQFLLISALTAQKTVIISGFIEDASSSERLIGATIVNDSTHTGTTTNSYGFFSLSTTSGVKNLTFSYIGYEAKRISVNLQHDTAIAIKLNAGSILKEVEVSARKQDRIENNVQMSKITVPIELIQRMPMILGEADVLKGLQLLPGVKGGSEGSAGIYVRGGSPDQNLILLDGVPIYNASHFGGLFSTFNTDAIRNVSLTKGGFPARFGGRLSSVLEIDTKEGNKKEWHADGAIGFISSKILVEGPIIKDKLSLMVSLRRTYYDLLLYPFFHKTETFGNTKTTNDIKLNFYDLNAKLNYVINDKNNLFLSVYRGNDVFGSVFKSESPAPYEPRTSNSNGSIEFGNTLASLRWNYVANNRLFVNTTLYYTKYNFAFIDENEFIYNNIADSKFRINDFSSSIRDLTLKTDFDFSINDKNRLRYGAGITSHSFAPSLTRIVQTGIIDTTVGSPITNSTEINLYAEDELQFGDFRANIGLHVSGVNVKGKNFGAVEPRVGLNYLFQGIAIKASYSQMTQYVHLLTNDALGLPSDAWVPAVQGIEPEKSHQVALGVAKTFGDNFELSIEGYYKTMSNLVSYKEGTTFLSTNKDWEQRVTQGRGETYGFEFFLQKKVGKTAGFIGYTLSWNNRQFDEINNGQTFPFKYDRRHELAIVLSHTLKERKNRKITLTANWIFSTGNGITVPTQTYTLPQAGNEVFYGLDNYKYSARNAYKTTNVHRLDFSLEFYRKYSKYERRWNMGLYNAYDHANPFLYFIKTTNEPYPSAYRATNVVQVSLIPVLPFVSYGIKF